MQVCIGVSRDFLELVEKNVLNSRPAWRVNASSIDSTANVALLIADHSLFSGKFLYIFILHLTIIRCLFGLRKDDGFSTVWYY